MQFLGIQRISIRIVYLQLLHTDVYNFPITKSIGVNINTCETAMLFSKIGKIIKKRTYNSYLHHNTLCISDYLLTFYVQKFVSPKFTLGLKQRCKQMMAVVCRSSENYKTRDRAFCFQIDGLRRSKGVPNGTFFSLTRNLNCYKYCLHLPSKLYTQR